MFINEIKWKLLIEQHSSSCLDKLDIPKKGKSQKFCTNRVPLIEKKKKKLQVNCSSGLATNKKQDSHTLNIDPKCV